jgi:acyl dehydratase
MSLNADLEGKEYPAISFEVDEARVRRFAAAVGEEGSSVPPTFATAPEIVAGLARVVEDADLGLDFTRVVHGEQEYEWVRPLVVGDTLTARATIESIRAKGGLEFLTLRTEMRDREGALVVVGRSSLVVRGRA